MILEVIVILQLIFMYFIVRNYKNTQNDWWRKPAFITLAIISFIVGLNLPEGYVEFWNPIVLGFLIGHAIERFKK